MTKTSPRPKNRVRGHIFWRFSGTAKGNPVPSREPRRREDTRAPALPVRLIDGVFSVAEQRVSRVGELHAYLVRPPGQQGDLQQGKPLFPVGPQYAVAGDRLLAGTGTDADGIGPCVLFQPAPQFARRVREQTVYGGKIGLFFAAMTNPSVLRSIRLQRAGAKAFSVSGR